MRLLFAVLLFFGIGCTSPRADQLSDPSPARVVAQGTAQLTMEVQELIERAVASAVQAILDRLD